MYLKNDYSLAVIVDRLKLKMARKKVEMRIWDVKK